VTKVKFAGGTPVVPPAADGPVPVMLASELTMDEPGSYPGQPWLWLFTLWYQVPGFSTSAHVDMIAIFLTGLGTILLLLIPFIPGLRDIPRLIPIHRLIWRSWYRPAPGPSPGQQARPTDKSPAGMA
jgi:hypothetical protein